MSVIVVRSTASVRVTIDLYTLAVRLLGIFNFIADVATP